MNKKSKARNYHVSPLLLWAFARKNQSFFVTLIPFSTHEWIFMHLIICWLVSNSFRIGCFDYAMLNYNKVGGVGVACRIEERLHDMISM